MTIGGLASDGRRAEASCSGILAKFAGLSARRLVLMCRFAMGVTGIGIARNIYRMNTARHA